MQVNQLTDDLCVRGQITPQDMDAIKAAGITTIICNRPDGEGPDQVPLADVRVAAEAAGLKFHENPIAPGAITPEAVRKQGDAIRNADGKVLAYCGSGQRATALWMLANPHGLSAEDRLQCASKAGYDLGGLRPHL